MTLLAEQNHIAIEGEWNWLDVYGKNMALFGAREENSENAIYVKVYGTDQSLQYNYEKMILNTFSKKSSLMPLLLMEFKYLDFQMLVYQDLPVMTIQQMNKSVISAMNEAMVEMWQLRPCARFISQCSRTKPLLSARLSEEKLSQLLVSAWTHQEKEQVKRLLNQHDHLMQLLNAMPLFVFNPVLNMLNLMVRIDGRPISFSWSNWSLEPIGVGVPERVERVCLEDMLKKASEKCRDLFEVTPEMVLMSGYASKLEAAISAQNFRQGLQFVPHLLENLDQCHTNSKK